MWFVINALSTECLGQYPISVNFDLFSLPDTISCSALHSAEGLFSYEHFLRVRFMVTEIDGEKKLHMHVGSGAGGEKPR